MRVKNYLNNKKGGLLIASILIMLIIFAVMVQFSSWTRQFTHANVHRIATQKALMNADSGIQMALTFLRTPQAAKLKAGIPFPQYTIASGTTYYVLMTRHTTDTTLIDLNCTGYYEVSDGIATDSNGLASQPGSISAVVQLHDVGDYFAASPGSLTIGYGSNISSGIVYANNLTFSQGATNPKTIVKSAQYTTSINPVNYSNYVTFLDPNSPYQLTVAPTLPVLDATMRNTYQNMAATTLSAGAILTGNLSPPVGATFPVFFSPGDVYVGTHASSCTITQSVLIYSQGDIHIVNNIVSALGTSAWPALMAEGNIYIDGGLNGAPDKLSINATMVTNGVFQASGNARPAGNTLSITGGIVVGSNGIVLSNSYWGTRNYQYKAPDPTLPLPFTTTIINYSVVKGKYNQ